MGRVELVPSLLLAYGSCDWANSCWNCCPAMLLAWIRLLRKLMWLLEKCR